MKEKITLVLFTFSAIILCYFAFTPGGRATWNNYFHTVQKVDDRTAYKTRKLVEDTARASIASYNADKLTYEQYKGSEDKEKQGWAEQAKMRANRTASTYNNYILKNSYVFEDNIPSDIFHELPYLD